MDSSLRISPYNKNNLLISGDISDPETFRKLAMFPSFSKWKGRALIIRNTGANLSYALEAFPSLGWEGGAQEIREAHERSLGAAERVIQMKQGSAVLPDDDYTYKREPMDHQRRGFLLSREKESFALLMEQGTGKTKVIIDNAQWLYLDDKIDGLIIIAWPNGVHRNWVEYELPSDMRLQYKALAWSPKHKTKKFQKALEEVKSFKSGLRVFSYNAEAFTSEAAQKSIEQILKSGRYMLCIDQSASIKNPSANRTKYILSLSKLAPYRRILDGQPVAEGAGELFSQFKFLDPWIIGHDTWTAFKAEFCRIGYFNEIVGYQNLDQLHERIDGHCYRVLADECLDLPKRIYKMWHFDLSPEERRIWQDLSLKSFAYFKPEVEELEGEEEAMVPETEVMEESLALVKNMRLQQISSGWFKPEEGELMPIREKGHPSRLEALLALLQSLGEEKAIIFSRFRPDLDLLGEVLGDKGVSFHGGVTEEERDEAKRMFMNNPDTLYFIGQPQSAGIGHTLTAAKHVIFYANHPSLRLREECEKRAHRKGLEGSLHIWDLVAGDTQDIKVITSLREKKLLSEQILQDPSSFFLNHE